MSTDPHPFARAHRFLPAAFAAVVLLAPTAQVWGETVPLAHPAEASDSRSDASDDPQLRQELAAIRDKYQQDRQALRNRSADLPPEERIRLHKELLEAHQSAIAKAEADSRSRSGGSRERWEERRDQRFERLKEVRRDGSVHKRR